MNLLVNRLNLLPDARRHPRLDSVQPVGERFRGFFRPNPAKDSITFKSMIAASTEKSSSGSVLDVTYRPLFQFQQLQYLHVLGEHWKLLSIRQQQFPEILFNETVTTFPP
jgi:hypothetical protein